MAKQRLPFDDDGEPPQGSPDYRDAPMELRLSVAQVAKRWQCSGKHIYNLVERSDLPALRIGSLIRFRREDIDAYENRTTTPRVQPPVPAPEPPPAGDPVADGMGSVQGAFLIGQRIAEKRKAKRLQGG
jgi:excisionase family DNA binding protein